MKLFKITPRGFCDGVVESWKLILKAKKDYANTNIYMLGRFVHNQNFVNSVLAHNLFLLDDTNTSRYDLIANTNFNKNDVIILSAHGTDEKTINLIKQKGLTLIDTTCQFVNKTKQEILNALQDKECHCLYLGKNNHPETNACISLSNRIILVNDLNDLKKCKNLFKKKVHVFNQTTLSIYDLENLYDFIKLNFANYQLHNEICTATQQRQEAIINLVGEIDLFIIVGDKKSNNSQSLWKIAQKKAKNAYLINSVDEIKDSWFKKINSIAISSGASTPTWITNEIINFIKEKYHIEEVIENVNRN